LVVGYARIGAWRERGYVASEHAGLTRLWLSLASGWSRDKVGHAIGPDNNVDTHVMCRPSHQATIWHAKRSIGDGEPEHSLRYWMARASTRILELESHCAFESLVSEPLDERVPHSAHCDSKMTWAPAP
jgi:hypothetical protein